LTSERGPAFDFSYLFLSFMPLVGGTYLGALLIGGAYRLDDSHFSPIAPSENVRPKNSSRGARAISETLLAGCGKFPILAKPSGSLFIGPIAQFNSRRGHDKAASPKNSGVRDQFLIGREK
jgi:hypothetical protein